MKNKIMEWLEEQGYPLEMRVASAFRDKGFEVRQSQYYADPDDGNFREIDIVATAPDFYGITNVDFVIECKTSKKPWIIFTADNILEGWNIIIPYCIHTMSARNVLVEKGIDVIKKLPGMKKGGRVAYGMTQAFTTGIDVTYKASTSVIKASIYRKRSLDKNDSRFLFIFPCIVVDCKIFECFFDADGEITIEEITGVDYWFSMEIAGELGTCIRIITLDKLLDYVEEAKSISDALLSILDADAKAKLKIK